MTMSQLRHDPLSGRDVIVAAGRAARPTTFATGDDAGASTDSCPFCPGQEARTPPEVARAGGGEPGEPGWQVRAFPNLYPIVDAHEVVVLSPDHRPFADLDAHEATAVVGVLRDRVHAHLDAGHAYGVAIVNHLRAAGASIAHPHAQVFALEAVPPAVVAALARWRDAGVDLVVQDAASEELVVARDGATTVWCPPASATPYQLRIAHDDAGDRFDQADDAIVAEVAVALRDSLHRLRAAVGGDVPYNVIVQTGPRAGGSFRWYVDVVPRLAVVAGFEQATGILVNTVPPEQAAALLRDTPAPGPAG
jgi:UDPglucose--hexose-1-phosphate uridylyltransferase